MASISITPSQVSAQPSALGSEGCQSGKEGHDAQVPRRLPNPPFVFPAPDPNSPLNDETETHVPPPLPAFAFNPGNVHTASPSTSTLSAPRPAGHRRRPSELIGGEAPPSPGMMSTSPGKAENLMPDALTLPQPGPGFDISAARRRGHAHRRSAAMSSMDLTALTKAFPTNPTGGSAPSTPADMKEAHELNENLSRPMSRSATSLDRSTPPASPTTTPADLLPGFQYTVAFAEGVASRPRPVSTISIETSSSLSTLRPSHSRVNSAAPSTRVESSPSPAKVRPKTADASLMFAQSETHLSPGDWQFPRSASTPQSPSAGVPPSGGEKDGKEKEKKKIKKKYLGEDHSKGSSKRSLEADAVEMSRDPSGDTWESASSTHSRSGAEDDTGSKAKKAYKKQKKVRSWAGSIFLLKSKRTHVKISRRSPTPPHILTRTNSDIGSMEAVDFDEDNTVIIRTPTNPSAPEASEGGIETGSDSKFEDSWKPRSFYEQNYEQDLEQDAFSPVIDLDAALGPFNTPEMSSGRVAGTAFSLATRRMYSGGRRGEFVGPEMRYHRRAESAPEMPPFDRSALGFPQLGSNSTLMHADVFYEEEEDAFLAGSQSSAAGDLSALSDSSASIAGEGEGAQPSSSDTLETVVKATVVGDAPVDDGLGIQVEDGPSDEIEIEDGPGDAVMEDADGEVGSTAPPDQSMGFDKWSRQAPKPPNLDVSPQMLVLEKRPCSSPVELVYGVPQLTLPSHHPSSSSAFPSPDPSNLSFEVPRSATASSMTDQTSFNNPFQDQTQGSIEDVPSLTSSASTRTGRPRLSSFYLRSSGDRSASFSAPSVPPRSSHANTAKRSSLVSLSRLVGGSYAEKSKLSYEEKPPADDTEKSKKRGRRISRLMTFWKGKHRSKDDGE